MIEQIQIYTRGCVRSIAVEKSLRKAVTKMGLDVQVEAYDDPVVHKAEGLDSFPSVKINGELRVEGDFTSVDDFEEMLTEYQN
ncbi:MAG: thioredoxin family protein [Deltaproteobacteria bacterium]|nr:thioredoxin family protein [Deltaproteobacteria bacterium]